MDIITKPSYTLFFLVEGFFVYHFCLYFVLHYFLARQPFENGEELSATQNPSCDNRADEMSSMNASN